METTDLVERLLLRAREFERATDFGGKMMDDARNRLEAAQSALQARVEKLEERIRTLVWNREKGGGNSDDGAMRAVEEELAAGGYCGIVEVNEDDFKADGGRE